MSILAAPAWIAPAAVGAAVIHNQSSAAKNRAIMARNLPSQSKGVRGAHRMINSAPWQHLPCLAAALRAARSESSMIRPTIPEDTPTLVALAEATGVFKPHEIVALREVLDDYHAENHAAGHRAVTYVQDDRIIGFAYYA